MSELGKLEILYVDERCFGCSVCGWTKFGANIYRSNDGRTIGATFICNQCMEQIIAEWLQRHPVPELERLREFLQEAFPYIPQNIELARQIRAEFSCAQRGE